jgi:rSAM/selenodomain-associated transferase 2
VVEIIIVDAPSSMDDMERLCKGHQVRYHRSSQIGRSRQMNEGAAIAHGEVLIFMHADVRPPTEICQYISESLSNQIQAGYFSYKFDRSSLLLQFNSWCTKFRGIFTGGGDQCLFIKASLFSSLGGFNNDYPIMEDFELYDRLKKNGVKITIIDKPLTVSARKYEDRSWLRVNFANTVVYFAYRLGIAPHKLQVWYKGLLG